MDRRTFMRRLALGTAAATAGTALFKASEAAAHSAGELAQRRYAVPFRGAQLWPNDTRIRIAQLSDIHVGWGTPAETLLAAQRAAHQAKPDLMVLTGDYLNHSLAEIDTLQAWVASLPRPIVATLGNHDHYSGATGIRRMLEAQGVIVLVNQNVQLDLGGRPLTVVGVDDGFTHRDDPERAFADLSRPDRALVLSHEPRTADRLGLHGGRLVLSGHTHGGQVSLPGITDILTEILGMRYVAGWYQAGDARLYVNAGVGASVRVPRLGEATLPELSLFDLGATSPG
jgi:predicted MPP superfamily phosphohydrolase